MTIEPADPHTSQEPTFNFILVDRFKGEALARITSSQSTIDMLNKPQWMLSKGWRYIRENQSEIKFPESP